MTSIKVKPIKRQKLDKSTQTSIQVRALSTQVVVTLSIDNHMAEENVPFNKNEIADQIVKDSKRKIALGE